MSKVKLKKKIPSIVYCGSLIQQDFGESLDKGVVLWEIDGKDIKHSRRFILNDYGFSKITISRGEDIDERVDNIRFSNDKRKTKVTVIYQDFEESFSQEKLSQIAQKVKDKYGTRVVNVIFDDLDKEVLIVEDENKDIDLDFHNFEKMFKLFLEENEFDLKDEEEEEEMLRFAMELENDMGLKGLKRSLSRYEIVEVEISNIFSFPIKPTKIPLGELSGILGIFGENFSGKSNTIRAIVWGLFQKILDGVHPKYLVNKYTDSNKGYVKTTMKIDDVFYRITRNVEVKPKSNSYPTKFEIYREVDGKMKWDDKPSDNDTADNNEIKKMVEDSIGTYEDFTKISVHANSEKHGYMNLDQQEKNDMLARYLDLHTYRERFKYANEPFKEIKRSQKELGQAVDVELSIKDLEKNKSDLERSLKSFEEEHELISKKRDAQEEMLLKKTRQLNKIESLGFDSKEELEVAISNKGNELSDKKKTVDDLKSFLKENTKKELAIDPNRTIEIINHDINKSREVFQKDKKEYSDSESWLKENEKKVLSSISSKSIVELEKIHSDLQLSLKEYTNKVSIHQGKTCPTCGSVTHKADPEQESHFQQLVEKTNKDIESASNMIGRLNLVRLTNDKHDHLKQRLIDLKAALQARKEVLENLKLEKENLEKNADLIKSNAIIDEKGKLLENERTLLSKLEEEFKVLEGKREKFDENKRKSEENEKIEKELSSINELIIGYKTSLIDFNNKMNDTKYNIRVAKNELDEKAKKLSNIKNVDKRYKKYAIYLQAVDRHGIPAMIIRKKLPLINNRVNNVLQSVADFYVEFNIDKKGNVSEFFYNTEDKSDELPLGLASGAQTFIISIAIKDALNYISKRSIVQPSIIMIDEGFGTLDPSMRGRIIPTLEYLKSKYKNVLIITHLDEIKEAADHIVEATRNRELITSENVDEKAGITVLSIGSA